MVVPVPVVLHEGGRQDPARRRVRPRRLAVGAPPGRVLGAGSLPAAGGLRAAEMASGGAAPCRRRRRRSAARDLGVTIEAQFVVGEYEIADPVGQGLDRARDLAARRTTTTSPRARPRRWRPTCATSRSSSWPRSTSRRSSATPDGVVQLSPLRFAFDTDELRLPVRLGLLNASGQAGPDRLHPAPERALRGGQLPQRLHPDQPRGGRRGPQELRRVLRRAVRRHHRAAWGARRWSPSTRGRRPRCDPCPAPPLQPRIWRPWASTCSTVRPSARAAASAGAPVPTRTRLRWLGQLGADPPARPLQHRDPVGGSGLPRGQAGDRRPRQLQRHQRRRGRPGERRRRINNFQGRYIIRHYWKGPVACKQPVYDSWGGPPGRRGEPDADRGQGPGPRAAGQGGAAQARCARRCRCWASRGTPPPRRRK